MIVCVGSAIFTCPVVVGIVPGCSALALLSVAVKVYDNALAENALIVPPATPVEEIVASCVTSLGSTTNEMLYLVSTPTEDVLLILNTLVTQAASCGNIPLATT